MRARHLTWVFMAALLCMFVGLADASTVTMQLRGLTVSRVNGVTHLKGTEPGGLTASPSTPWYVGMGALHGNSSAIANGMNNTVFGMTAPLAANAADVAVTALKLNPAGLLTSAVASYALSKGLEYLNGEWTAPSSTVQPTTNTTAKATVYFLSAYSYTGPNYSTVQAAGDSAASASVSCTVMGSMAPDSCSYTGPVVLGVNHSTTLQAGYALSRQAVRGSDGATLWIGLGLSAGNTFVIQSGQGCVSPAVASGNNCVTTTCPSGYNLTNGQCVSVPKTVDQAWQDMAASQWPDAAIRDMVSNGVPLPTDKSVFAPPYADIPLGDPVVDPVTQKRMQDVARVTPSPSQPDTADVQVVKREVDANGQPVLDSGTGQPVPPKEETDWCKLNPDASGCKPLDEVPDVELEENTITLSISPVAGFGPDTGTCPADRTLFSKGGSPIVWSWGQYCTFAEGIRPLIVGFAWLSALMIVVGVARRNS